MAREQWRGKFNPEAEFVVRRRMTVGGLTFLPGEPFDKTKVDARRLRVLFDHRSIIYPGTNPGAPQPASKKTKLKGGDAPPAEPEAEVQPEGEEEPAAGAEDEPSEEEKRAAVLEVRRSVEIGEKWRELNWPQLLSLAASVSDSTVHNKAEAVAAVEAELARRAELP